MSSDSPLFDRLQTDEERLDHIGTLLSEAMRPGWTFNNLQRDKTNESAVRFSAFVLGCKSERRLRESMVAWRTFHPQLWDITVSPVFMVDNTMTISVTRRTS